MKRYSFLIKPASKACNMACDYCFYKDLTENMPEKRPMSNDTVILMLYNVSKSVNDGDEVTFTFQGGEPTLCKKTFFENFVRMWKKILSEKNLSVKTEFALQTNGLLLSSDFCEFLKENDFLVGLSLDGPLKFHDKNRKKPNGDGTYSEVMAAKRRLEKAGVRFNVLWVLTESAAASPHEAFDFLLSENIKFVQFIPCLSSKNRFFADVLSPESFASFYTTVFSLWKKELFKGNYISIKFFDDIFNLLIKREVTACGFTGKCQCQTVIESDGTVYPCDFFVSEKYLLGNIKKESPEFFISSPLSLEFENREKEKFSLCESCSWKNICNGGCEKMAENMYVDRKNNICGYKKFLDDNKNKINEVADFLIKNS